MTINIEVDLVKVNARLVDWMARDIAVNTLISDVRPADRAEWEAASPHDVGQSLRNAVKSNSGNTWMVVDGRSGHVPMIYGVTPDPFELAVGHAWLIATNFAERHVHALHRFFKAGMADMHKNFPILYATAYHKNEMHHTWMERMGFKRTGGVQFMGPHCDKFIQFVHERSQA